MHECEYITEVQECEYSTEVHECEYSTEVHECEYSTEVQECEHSTKCMNVNTAFKGIKQMHNLSHHNEQQEQDHRHCVCCQLTPAFRKTLAPLLVDLARPPLRSKQLVALIARVVHYCVEQCTGE